LGRCSEVSPLLMGDMLSLMALATEIAANSGCIIYDALFVALAEYENTVVRLHSSNCAE
jgi:predicted nucleic acid-binding protein